VPSIAAVKVVTRYTWHMTEPVCKQFLVHTVKTKICSQANADLLHTQRGPDSQAQQETDNVITDCYRDEFDRR
jgi:hypothetical protein